MTISIYESRYVKNKMIPTWWGISGSPEWYSFDLSKMYDSDAEKEEIFPSYIDVDSFIDEGLAADEVAYVSYQKKPDCDFAETFELSEFKGLFYFVESRSQPDELPNLRMGGKLPTYIARDSVDSSWLDLNLKAVFTDWFSPIQKGETYTLDAFLQGCDSYGSSVIVTYVDKISDYNELNVRMEPYEFKYFYKLLQEEIKKEAEVKKRPAKKKVKPEEVTASTTLPVEEVVVNCEAVYLVQVPVEKPSLFATIKESGLNAAREAGSTAFAEKITDVVVGRLPKSLQLAARAVPRPVLVYGVSSVVCLVAMKFEIPGKEQVLSVSQAAMMGSAFEGMRVFLKLLDPIFTAIRELAPSDLLRIVDEAKKEELWQFI